MLAYQDFAQREFSRSGRKIDPFISLSSLSSFFSFSSSSFVSRERENRSVSGPEARTLDLSFSFSALSGGSERRISTSRDRLRLRSFHLSSSSSLHIFLFLLRIFILSSLCPTLLPISSLAHPSSSLCRYPVSLITLLYLFIVHLCYVTDTLTGCFIINALNLIDYFICDDFLIDSRNVRKNYLYATIIF